MKKLFLLLAPILLWADLTSEFKNLNAKQQWYIQQAYIKGKEFNVQWSLAAIVWKESEAGKYNINLSDPSCGAFHANINSVMRRHTYKDSSFMRNIICQRLIDSFDFASAEAIAELEYWVNEHNGNWVNVWASYNAGYAFNGKVGQRYAKDISKRIRVLKRLLTNIPK